MQEGLARDTTVQNGHTDTQHGTMQACAKQTLPDKNSFAPYSKHVCNHSCI